VNTSAVTPSDTTYATTSHMKSLPGNQSRVLSAAIVMNPLNASDTTSRKLTETKVPSDSSRFRIHAVEPVVPGMGFTSQSLLRSDCSSPNTPDTETSNVTRLASPAKLPNPGVAFALSRSHDQVPPRCQRRLIDATSCCRVSSPRNVAIQSSNTSNGDIPSAV
jgi:hypothetical protein